MKKLFTLMLAMLASTSILFAERVQIGDLYYELTDSLTAEVSYEVYSDYNNYPNLTTIDIPANVQYDGNTYRVTSIGERAFKDCSLLTNVTIPQTVKTIGYGAFERCTGLTSIVIPDSVTTIEGYTFFCCSNLSSVTLPQYLKKIDQRAFESCINLESIVFPNSLTNIVGSAFSFCTKLTSVEIPSNVEFTQGNAFSGCLQLDTVILHSNKVFSAMYPSTFGTQVTHFVLGEEITTIHDAAFQNYSQIVSVTMSDSVTSVGDLAFQGCTNLIEINMPAKITNIGNNAFAYCRKLPTIEIPINVINIGDNAFQTCESLHTVTWNAKHCTDFTEYNTPFQYSTINSIVFGDKVEHIPAYLCHAMNQITSISLPSTIISIGEGAFMGCNKLPSITIPYSVTNIGTNAFFQCDQLTKIDVDAANVNYCSVGGILFDKGQTRLIQYPAQKSGTYVVPNSVTKIENNAFYNSIGITAVTIPNSVAELGDYTFYGCTALKSVTLSNQLTALGNSVFANCSALLSVSVPNNVLSIGTASFSNCSRLETITLGTELETIGSNAFANCKHVVDIYSYAYATPVITSSTFSGVSRNAYVWVPEDMVRRYQIDELWNEFQILPIGAVSTTTDGSVLIQPSDNNASITWPTAENAAMYSLTITKEGQTICTLCFNAQGILTNIAFAPSINGKAHVSAALLTEQGYQFTVTGLDPGTLYAYQIDVTDNQNRTIASYTGTFLTTGSSEAIDNIDVVDKSGKFIKDGTLYIRQGDALYNVNGRRIK